MAAKATNGILLTKLNSIHRTQAVQGRDIKELKVDVKGLNEFMIKELAIDDYELKRNKGDLNKDMMTNVIKVIGLLALIIASLLGIKVVQ